MSDRTLSDAVASSRHLCHRFPHLEALDTPPPDTIDPGIYETVSSLIALTTKPAALTYVPPPRPRCPFLHISAAETKRREKKADADEARAARLHTITTETGHPAAPDWAPRPEKNHSQRQTERLAELIGGLHIPADKGGRKLYFQPVLGSETPVEIKEYRNCNLLPEIARKNRKPVKNLLQYYLEREEKRNRGRREGKKYTCRMVVFNAGRSCLVEEIGERIKKVCKKIQNAAFLMKDAELPFDFLARNIEIAGFVRNKKDLFGKEMKELEKNTDEKGRTLFHVHAHVLVQQREKINGHDWKNYLRKIGATKGNGMKKGKGHDAGMMRGAEEITKYLTKTEGLELLDPTEIKEIFAQTFRRKVLHLSGPALDLKGELAKTGKTLLPPRNGRGWKLEPVCPRKPRKKAENAAPATRPQVLTTTIPAPTASPMSIAGVLFRARPEDAATFVDRWQFTRLGRAVNHATKTGLLARGITPESLAALCLVHNYDDSALKDFPGEIDPSEVDQVTLFPDLF